MIDGLINEMSKGFSKLMIEELIKNFVKEKYNLVVDLKIEDRIHPGYSDDRRNYRVYYTNETKDGEFVNGNNEVRFYKIKEGIFYEIVDAMYGFVLRENNITLFSLEDGEFKEIKNDENAVSLRNYMYLVSEPYNLAQRLCNDLSGVRKFS